MPKLYSGEELSSLVAAVFERDVSDSDLFDDDGPRPDRSKLDQLLGLIAGVSMAPEPEVSFFWGLVRLEWRNRDRFVSLTALSLWGVMLEFWPINGNRQVVWDPPPEEVQNVLEWLYS